MSEGRSCPAQPDLFPEDKRRAARERRRRDRLTVVMLFEAVAELHGRGLQRLRIRPAMAPSGLAWRLWLSAADDFVGPTKTRPGLGDLPCFSTAGGTTAFSIADFDRLEPPEAADRILAGFPNAVRRWRGSDPAYAAWVLAISDRVRAGELPVFFADGPTGPPVHMTGGDRFVPPPWPPG